jgi:hypothetical protein
LTDRSDISDWLEELQLTEHISAGQASTSRWRLLYRHLDHLPRHFHVSCICHGGEASIVGWRSAGYSRFQPKAIACSGLVCSIGARPQKILTHNRPRPHRATGIQAHTPKSSSLAPTLPLSSIPHTGEILLQLTFSLLMQKLGPSFLVLAL